MGKINAECIQKGKHEYDPKGFQEAMYHICNVCGFVPEYSKGDGLK